MSHFIHRLRSPSSTATKQVDMACHQTIPSQPHRQFLASLPYQVYKRGEVVIFMKDVTAAIAPIQDMVNKPTS